MDTDSRWVSLAEDETLAQAVAAIERDVPPFLAELTSRHRAHLSETDPARSWVVHEGDLPVAVVRAVRLAWDGTSEGAPEGGAGEATRRAGEEGADTLAVLDVTVAFGARGRGVGADVLRSLDERRRLDGSDRLLVLLRPHAKATYPLVPFARYASFTRPDGGPFDPWFRSAWDVGLVPVRAAERSLSARADLAAWQRWLGIEVPGSGPYLVDGAIKPAIVEVERDEGRYREPHLWFGTGLRAGPDTPATGDAVHEHDRGADAPRAWVAALARAGVVAGDRAHREPKRR